MRIVVLGKYSEDESTSDGALRHIVGLCTALEQFEDIELHIVTLGSKHLTKRLGRKTLHIVPRRGFPLEIALFSSLPLIKQVSVINPDLIHCIGTTQPYGLPTLYLAKRRGIKAIVTVLGIVQAEARFWFTSPLFLFHRLWYPWVERKMLAAFPVMVLTENIKKRVLHLTNQPINVIPPGIDDRFFVLERPDIDNNLVICVSVIEPRKGLIDLLQAVKLLNEQLLMIRLIHIGKVVSTSYYNQLQRYVQQNLLPQQVIFRGEVDQPGLEQSLQKAACSVLPSYEESFGLSIAESMAAGVPVVTTRVGGLQNLVCNEKNGLLVEPNCPEGLAQAIKRVLTESQLAQRLAQEGRNHARIYKWSLAADQTRSIYKQVLSENK